MGGDFSKKSLSLEDKLFFGIFMRGRGDCSAWGTTPFFINNQEFKQSPQKSLIC